MSILEELNGGKLFYVSVLDYLNRKGALEET